MKRNILLTLNKTSVIVPTGAVVLNVRALRRANNSKPILNNRNNSDEAMNLLRITVDKKGKSGFCANLMGAPIHASLLCEALQAVPMPLKELDKLNIDWSYCYKQINRNGDASGIIGENNITQTNEYIPIHVTKNGFKIAFDTMPDGFMHVKELAQASVMKLEADKIASMNADSNEIDKAMKKPSTPSDVSKGVVLGYNMLARFITGNSEGRVTSDRKVASNKSKIGIRRKK